MTSLELRRQRAALAEQLRGLIPATGTTLTSEQREQFDRIDADIRALDSDIDRVERAEQIERNAPQQEQRGGENSAEEQRAAFAAWVQGGAAALTPEQRSAIRLIGSAEARAQGVGSSGAGGATVPQGFMPELEQALLLYGGMLTSGARIVTTASGNALPWPTLNDTGNSGEITDENTAVNAQDLTFSSLTLNAFKYDSKSVLVSFELLQDGAFNFDQIIAPILGERIGRKLNADLTTGAGTTLPKGIVTASTLGVTTAAVNAVTFDEVTDLIHSVDPAYRMSPNFRLMFNDSTLKALKKIKDNNGRPIWAPGYTAGEPNTIGGYPYIVNQQVASMATGAKFMVAGDFSKYLIRRVKDVQLYRIVDKYIEQGSVGFLAYARFDGNLIDAGTHPVKYMKNA